MICNITVLYYCTRNICISFAGTEVELDTISSLFQASQLLSFSTKDMGLSSKVLVEKMSVFTFLLMSFTWVEKYEFSRLLESRLKLIDCHPLKYVGIT